MKILITSPEGRIRDVYFPEEVLDALGEIGDIKMNNTGKRLTSEELGEMIKGVDICVTHWDTPKFTPQVLKNCDRLRMVAHAAGSVAGFITDGVYEKGITVCSANTIMARHVAEGVLAFMFAGLRHIPEYDSEVKAGKWPRFDNEKPLFKSKVGLVGLGTVGRFLLDLLRPFNTEVRVYDPYIDAKSLDEYGNVSIGELEDILAWGDIISLHASRTPETRNMINRERLGMIRDGALFVNTSRGALVDEEALADELAKERFYAVLDVYEKEPLPEDSPLMKLKNVILIPHRAGITAREQMTFGIIDEIERFLEGQPLQYEIPYEKYRLMTR